MQIVIEAILESLCLFGGIPFCVFALILLAVDAKINLDPKRLDEVFVCICFTAIGTGIIGSLYIDCINTEKAEKEEKTYYLMDIGDGDSCWGKYEEEEYHDIKIWIIHCMDERKDWVIKTNTLKVIEERMME